MPTLYPSFTLVNGIATHSPAPKGTGNLRVSLGTSFPQPPYLINQSPNSEAFTS